LSENQTSLAAAEKAIGKASASGAILVLARARVLQCRSFADIGQPDSSKHACEEAQRIYKQAGDLAGVARTLHATAEVPLNQGDLGRAKKLYEQALSIAQQIGDKRTTEREMGNIGLIYAQQGDLATAENVYQQSLGISREIGDKHGMAVDMGNLGDVLHSQGRFADALASYTTALQLARDVGHRLSESIDLQLIGDVLADEGDLEAATKKYDEALPIQRDIGSRSYYAATLVSIGNVLRQNADAAGAKKAYEEALSIRQKLGEKGTSADTQLALAQLACDTGHAADAEPLIRAAMLELHAERETDHEILAAALLSKSILQQSKLPDAQKIIADGLKLVAKSQDVTVRLPLTISSAYVRVAAKDFAGAERLARDALAVATKLNYVPLEFEASLALGAIEMQANDTAAGRDRLVKLEKAAKARHFELIARKAAAAAKA
jgi:tetratricopeptide (TPR) repeat protein